MFTSFFSKIQQSVVSTVNSWKQSFLTTILSWKVPQTILMVSVHAIVWYSHTVQYLRTNWSTLCTRYPTLQSWSDHISYMIKYVGCSLINQRIEPFYGQWVYIGLLKTNARGPSSRKRPIEKQLYDMYEMIDNETWSDNDSAGDDLDEPFTKRFQEFCHMAKISAGDDVKNGVVLNKIENSIVIMKRNNQYSYRTFYPLMCEDNDIIEFPLQPSTVRFLSIEYKHPLMLHSIFLTLSPEHYYVGNQLFSAAFIKRMLQQQSISYHFDGDYDLVIMDNKIRSFQMTSNQYVELQKTTYIIMRDRKPGVKNE